MPDEQQNTPGEPSRPPPNYVKNRQRDPTTFSGSPQGDVDDWLKHYDRVSAHNRWDDSHKLANVVFFLKDTAFQWFDNHEDDINSWDGFKTSFSEAFRKPESCKQQAKEKLSHRFQAATETSTSYIEDVLRLCRRVDEQMSEEDKIRHLFKGLSQELFSVVAPKTPATVQRLISECKTYEEMQSSRINKAPFERLPEVPLSPVSNLNLPQLIRTIIRDELRRYFNPSSLTDDASECAIKPETIQKVVQKELRAALQPPTLGCLHVSAPL